MNQVFIDGKEYVLKSETINNEDIEQIKRENRILDLANVIAMVNVVSTKDGLGLKALDFIFDEYVEVEAHKLITENERIKLYVKNKYYTTISVNYYFKACKVYCAWYGKKNISLKIYVNKLKENEQRIPHPVLLGNGEGLGFVLAPRIEEEFEE